MSTAHKNDLQLPCLPARLEQAERPEELIWMARHSGEALKGWSIVGANLAGEDLRELELEGCVLQGCRLTGCDLRESRWQDVVLRQCDVSGVQAGESSFCRVHWQDVKALGADLSNSGFHGLLMEDCRLERVNFSDSVFKFARMCRCNLTGAWFQECRHSQLEWENCTLVETNFFKTPLKGVDFTSSQMERPVLSDTAQELKGAIVSWEQAAQLAALLGLVIR